MKIFFQILKNSSIIFVSLVFLASCKNENPKKTSEQLKAMRDHYTNKPSDINEHLPILEELAKKSPQVTEIGIRNMVSTWAILNGLCNCQSKDRSYVGIDLYYPSIESLILSQTLAEATGINYQFLKGNDMNINVAPTDLLFIDSLHTYVHLTYELNKFAPNVRKYIALHDTSDPWGTRDDTEYHGDFSEYPPEIDRKKRGLWAAVVDFLQHHPEWTLKERHFNNHGFTVLERNENL